MLLQKIHFKKQMHFKSFFVYFNNTRVFFNFLLQCITFSKLFQTVLCWHDKWYQIWLQSVDWFLKFLNIAIKHYNWFLKFLNIAIKHYDWFLKFLNIAIKHNWKKIWKALKNIKSMKTNITKDPYKLFIAYLLAI